MAQPPKPLAEKPTRNAYRAAFEQATNVASATETLGRCAEVEAAVEALRVRYEQFFLGLSRLPPSDDHALVRSAVLQLRHSFVRNTSARFRVQSLHNRFLAYERLWQRTCREIEEGTYRRDLFKLRLRQKKAEPSADDVRAAGTIDSLRRRQAAEPQADAPTDDDFSVHEEAAAPKAAPRVPAPPPAARVAPPSPPAVRAPSAAGPVPLSDEKLRPVYEAYVAAKKRCRENVDGLDFDAVANSLRRQVPQLLADHRAQSVDFKVVISGGKAVLKAVPR